MRNITTAGGHFRHTGWNSKKTRVSVWAYSVGLSLLLSVCGVTTTWAKTSKFQNCKFPSHAASDIADGWRPLDWSNLTRSSMDDPKKNSWRVFDNKHPKCSRNRRDCNTALSTDWIDLKVNVYIQGSDIWTDYKRLANYFILTRNYYRQAKINLKFKCYTPPSNREHSGRDRDRLSIIFGKGIPTPDGKVADGWGNLPRGLAVINDQIMDRPKSHANPYFLPGKPIGHEIGHVLGLAHAKSIKNLMAQGTASSNQLDLKPIQAVIMRIMAINRFGAVVGSRPTWVK